VIVRTLHVNELSLNKRRVY